MGGRPLNLARATRIAEQAFREHSLDDWTFTYDRAVQRAGACFYRQKRISLSRVFVGRNEEPTVVDTLLHEIAHALAWRHDKATGHGVAWRRWCSVVGARPVRCYDGEVDMPSPRYECTVLAREASWSTGKGLRRQSGVAKTGLEPGETFGRHRLTRKLRAAVRIGLVAVWDSRREEWIEGRQPA